MGVPSALINSNYVIMPQDTAVAVIAVTTSSQSIDLSARTELTGDKLEGGRFLSIVVEQNTWVNFSATSGTVDQTATTGATQGFLIPAYTRLDGIVVGAKHFLNIKGASAGYARLYVATRSPQAVP